MNFFEQQEQARRRTGQLVVLYGLAVVCILMAVYAVVVWLFQSDLTGANADHQAVWWDPIIFSWVALVTGLLMLGGTLYKISALRAGGAVVARMLGGRPIAAATQDPDEQRLLNVVEEMAIASGVPVPRVYLLDQEDSINAFAAGFSPSDAVIGVTRGAVRTLSRDELQGVMAHEFSHILNGDMRLNIRLMGVLHGILILALLGYWMMRVSARSASTSRRGKKGGGGAAALVLLGLALMIIGYIGVFFGKLIKSAVSRQREFLADAAAVQFTRNPDGIANALKKIGGLAAGSRLVSPHAEEASHLFFADGLRAAWFNLMSTHPPLAERIRRIDPSFRGDFPAASPAVRPDIQPAAVPGSTRGTVLAPAFAGQPTISLTPAAVAAHVGTLTADHLAYASHVIENIPLALQQAARNAETASALLLTLLLDNKAAVRERQLRLLSTHESPARYRLVLQYIEPVSRLAPECRLPLADLLLTALRALPPAAYRSLRETAQQLIAADAEVNLYEYALLRMLVRNLDAAFGLSRPAGGTPYRDFAPVKKSLHALLSALAWTGADDPKRAAEAWAAAVGALGITFSSPMAPRQACSLQEVDRALDDLARLAPTLKEPLMRACVACVAADRRVSVEEAELLRAIADALDCPLPPFLSFDDKGATR